MINLKPEGLSMIDPAKYSKSRYLKASDLKHPRTRVRIHSVAEELVGTPGEQKVVVTYTTPTLKLHAMNKTNLEALVEHFGLDETTWPGKVVILVKTTAMYNGKLVDAIRLEFPPQPVTPAPVAAQPALTAGAEVSLEESNSAGEDLT
jgi:hypothetical protein